MNEAVADYPDVCLTLTGEKHYYAVGEEVPELVQYDAGLVFDIAHAVTLDEMKATDEIIFQAMYMAKAPQLNPFQEAKETALAKDFSVVRSQEYIFELCQKATLKQQHLKALSENLASHQSKSWHLVMLPTTLKCLNLLIIALLWEMRQTKSNLFCR